ncbi:hypothetical protein D3C75_1187330 [compost metagenome]
MKIIERAQNDLACSVIVGKRSLVVDHLPVADIETVVAVAEALDGEVVAEGERGSGHIGSSV